MRTGFRLPFLRILDGLLLLLKHEVVVLLAAAARAVLRRLDQNENSHLISSFSCYERTTLRTALFMTRL